MNGSRRGRPTSTIELAKAFPAAHITGFDYHEASIATGRERADTAGIGGRVRFEVAAADAFGGDGYDLVCVFDALHDMGDPVGAARHIRERAGCPPAGRRRVAPRAATILQVVTEAGFTRFRHAVESPTNLVLEIRR